MELSLLSRRGDNYHPYRVAYSQAMRQIQMYSSHCTSREHSVNDGIQEKKFIWEVWLKIAIVVVVMLLACPLEDVDQG